ncbi:hypothetical protein GGTG_12194 [Gaeumannomyces tritici R3-111a-1]|uniref:Uncharacterized protein n=1 Tax=Gaeumannomyces tritici (strain R3-111a-1) TaxID=644352 RepID=J3PFB7_GAET3|nr:hypothetical protein GGTG_12194 [Gaeumannomyces tritici R3-111a-1]EJT70019.1 hypothetical protein GGTG_12194 [Gaeumannomyces tritici R3-111a-1]
MGQCKQPFSLAKVGRSSSFSLQGRGGPWSYVIGSMLVRGGEARKADTAVNGGAQLQEFGAPAARHRLRGQAAPQSTDSSSGGSCVRHALTSLPSMAVSWEAARRHSGYQEGPATTPITTTRGEIRSYSGLD